MRGTHWGQGYNRPTGRSAEKTPHATFNFFNFIGSLTVAILEAGDFVESLELYWNCVGEWEWYCGFVWKRFFELFFVPF
jgi:hypothetical protein